VTEDRLLVELAWTSC